MRLHTTRAQRLALFEVYSRGFSDSYQTFRKACRIEMFSGRKDGTYTVLVNWAGMLLGIEPDGYIHS